MYVVLTDSYQSAPTLQMFFYAMLSHPEVQKRGQEELQRVVGLDRLPTMDDRPKLPYIEAILKELLRWNPVTPLGMSSPFPTQTSI